jgi:small-conductance mechanosensitive channel
MADEAQPAADLDAVADTLQSTVLGVWTEFVGHVPYLVAGLFVVVGTWCGVALFHRLSHRLFRRSKLRPSLQELIVRLLTIGLWGAGLLLAAMVVFPGLTPTRALGGLGVASLAVGFAFKDIFENFFAGILILWRFPFETGDFIQCEGIEGKVEDVTIRMTVIRQVTGELVVVPNGLLFKNPVEVLTDPPKRRITVMTGVAYGEDVEEAVAVIEDALESCETVASDRDVEIFPHAFGASSIDIEVTWWTDPKPLDVRRSRGEVVTAVKKALDDAGIEIPFPYRTLTFKEPLRVGSEGSNESG